MSGESRIGELHLRLNYKQLIKRLFINHYTGTDMPASAGMTALEGIALYNVYEHAFHASEVHGTEDQ